VVTGGIWPVQDAGKVSSGMRFGAHLFDKMKQGHIIAVPILAVISLDATAGTGTPGVK
jgi:hypothetical protein